MPVPATDPGPFLSGLDWLSGVGEIPMNLLRGRPGAAGRRLADTLLDIPDALLPGDWIPQISTPEDRISASELVGVDDTQHPGLARAADIVGGTLLNPLSYVGLRGGTIKAGLPLTEGTAIPGATEAIQGARRVAGRATDLIPVSARQTAANTAGAVRRTLNWLDVPAEGQALTNQAQGAGYQAGRLGSEEVKRIYHGLTPAEVEAVGELSHGIQRSGADRSGWATIDDPAMYLSGRQDIRPDVVQKAAQERQALMDLFAGEPNVGLSKSPEGYIQRQFSGDYFNDIVPPEFVPKAAPKPQALKGREESLKTKQGLLKFLQENPEAELDFNAMNVDARRSAQQGRLVEKAALGKKLTGNEEFQLSNAEHRGAVEKAIADIGREQPDYAYKLNNLWKGQPPRGDDWFSKGLHTANKTFKSAATYGVLLPRIGFSVRNRISGLWQALSNDQARGTLGPSTGRAFSDLMGAVDDGIVKLTGSRKLKPSELTRALDHIDTSFKQAGGDPKKFRELLASDKVNGPYLQEALDNGVLDAFVSSEQLINEMAKTPNKQRVLDLLEWPAAIARGVEQRMRLGTYLDLRKGKAPIAKDGAEAAQTIRDTFLDYSLPGVANRRLRDAVPFAAFTTQTIKQQGQFLARHPVAGVAVAPLFGEDEDLPKYPWLDQQMALPVGTDEKGNAQYLSGLGLPIEALTAIPGTAPSDIYRDLVSPLQPLLKTGISYVADKDPFTGQEFGTYDKILGQPMGEFGRAANIAKGTGLFQPVTAPLDQATNILDERKSIAERVIQNTTGAKFTSVDADLAEKQRLESYLEANPQIKSYRGLYQQGDDEGLDSLLKQLRDAKARLKEKRAAAAAL